MEKMIAYCGINCSICPTFLATQNNDDNLRQQVIEMYKKLLKIDLKLEDVNCDGCNSNGRLSYYCKMCRISKCAKKNNYENCAHCEKYVCKKLEGIFSFSKVLNQKPKETLDEIKRGLKIA